MWTSVSHQYVSKGPNSAMNSHLPPPPPNQHAAGINHAPVPQSTWSPFATQRHYYHAIARALYQGYNPEDLSKSSGRRPPLPAELVILIFHAGKITEMNFSRNYGFDWSIENDKGFPALRGQDCRKVTANNADVARAILWATPVIDRTAFKNMAGIQLSTLSRDQGWAR